MAKFTQGDTSPALTGVCENDDAPANITGATLALHIRKPSGEVLTVAGTIVSGAAGTWSYQWVTGDLDEAGKHAVEVQVTYSGGAIQTFGPTSFAVEEQLA